ncbi:hypothetical protein BGZ80_001116 [Entomortierella chlamydospora]|uniref:Uncharacterized protein n=1 Tax=Entomortierella chlamydospora TaxID=101097 RepID=A0A9P6N360_9FUNG|nr:hypothetical protein BGZ80_001116 [Entomortierella chlamydospora]
MEQSIPSVAAFIKNSDKRIDKPMTKEKVRRELDLLKSCNNIQAQQTQEQPPTAESNLKNSLPELVAIPDSNDTNAAISPSIRFNGGTSTKQCFRQWYC